jgi:oligoribonuclease (3'-5' exoribonuclease)
VNQIYVIITDGNLNILNNIYVDMTNKSNKYSLLVGFLQKNILVNRSSPICGQRVHIDRARIQRVAPEFLSCCHYRSIDVDVLDVLCRRWARKVYENRP